MSQRIGLPIIAMKITPVMEHNGKDRAYYKNRAVTVMHRHLDPSLHTSFWTTGECFGEVENFWCTLVGNVLVVRKDRKPLAPYLMEAVCGFCEDGLSEMFACVRSEDSYIGALLKKEQLLDKITPEKWEAYLEQWKKAKGVGAEWDEESDMDDDEGDNDFA